jgi:hypothetical protein
MAFAIGLLPGLVLIGGYHWICFGTPFTLAYQHEAVFTQMHKGFFGINWPPKVSHAYALLFDPNHGLLFWSPFLLLAFIGYFKTFCSSRGLFWICYLVPVLQILLLRRL